MPRNDYQELIVALTGGLNTSADPAEIGNDELAESTGLEYRPPNVGLFNTPGRSSFATWTAGGNLMHGLVFAQFDVTSTADEGKRLIGFAGTSAFGACATGQTGAFATLKSDLSTTATAFADGGHYGNDWLLWNGADRSWAVWGTNLQASALHGMIPITTSISAVATASAGEANTI